MKTLNKIFVFSLIALALAACPGKSSKKKTRVEAFNNPIQCQDHRLNVGGQIGIPGNTACPYQGAYDPNRGYQGYGFHFEAGIGFSLDFDWAYNDLCPEIGQRPIFQNGQFSRCTSVNPLFVQRDPLDPSRQTVGECAGEQFNPDITGCRAQLRPMNSIRPNFNQPIYLPTIQSGSLFNI